MPNPIQVKQGDKYNRLTIIKELEKRNKKRIFLCICECGDKCKVILDNLRTGHTKSCGCLQVEARKKHGMQGTKPYIAWENMKGRCNVKSRPNYKDYGGRGITYDKKWEKFEGFWEDMGKSYMLHKKQNGKKQTTLDRIDVNGNYCKENCRWTTYSNQIKNRRPYKRKGIEYKDQRCVDIIKQIGLHPSTFRHRLRRGRDLEEALLTPKYTKNV